MSHGTAPSVVHSVRLTPICRLVSVTRQKLVKKKLLWAAADRTGPPQFANRPSKPKYSYGAHLVVAWLFSLSPSHLTVTPRCNCVLLRTCPRAAKRKVWCVSHVANDTGKVARNFFVPAGACQQDVARRTQDVAGLFSGFALCEVSSTINAGGLSYWGK